MELSAWFTNHWFTVLQSMGIVGGLLFTGLALRLDAKSRRISNLIDLTDAHREIWSQLLRRPDLNRVLDASPELKGAAVSIPERIFVVLLITHLNCVYHSLEAKLSVKPEELRRDIRRLFARPIPRAVWAQVKSVQDGEFVQFVEACLGSNGARTG
jgi:hypothetical protein